MVGCFHEFTRPRLRQHDGGPGALRGLGGIQVALRAR